MASFKVIRRLALGHHARGLCHKQDVLQADHFQPRLPLQLLAALEEHVESSGKELVAALKESFCWQIQKEKMEKESLRVEKESLRMEKESLRVEKESLWAMLETEKKMTQLLEEKRAKDAVAYLQLKGLNDTRGLFEKLQADLAFKVQATTLKGSRLWEAILNDNQNLGLRLCIQRCTNIPKDDVARQAAHCHTMYNLLSQHVHAGKELQAAHGRILFQRGPMSPEQVEIFLCMGQAAGVNIAEDPSTRPS